MNNVCAAAGYRSKRTKIVLMIRANRLKRPRRSKTAQKGHKGVGPKQREVAHTLPTVTSNYINWRWNLQHAVNLSQKFERNA